MEYLGHIVGHDGLKVDPKKIKSMENKPCPRTFKIFSGFLGPRSHYQKFFYNYGKITGPLTNQENKISFLGGMRL